MKSLSDRGEPKIQLNLSDADLLGGIARPKSCAEFGLAFDSPLLGIIPLDHPQISLYISITPIYP